MKSLYRLLDTFRDHLWCHLKCRFQRVSCTLQHGDVLLPLPLRSLCGLCTLLPAPTPHQPPKSRLDKENSQSTTWHTNHVKLIYWPKTTHTGVWRGTRNIGDELTCVPVPQVSFWKSLKAQLCFMIWRRTVRVVRATESHSIGQKALDACGRSRRGGVHGQKFTSKSAVSIKGRNLH